MTPEELDSQIRALMKDCIETPIDILVSNPRLGELDFEDVRDDLEKAFSIFNKFLTLPIDKLPIDEIPQIIQKLKPLKNAIDGIKYFDGTKSFDNLWNIDAVNLRNDVVAELKREIHNLYTIAEKWIPYLIDQSSGASGDMNKPISAVAESRGTLASTKTKKDEIDAGFKKTITVSKIRKDEIEKETVAARKSAETAKEAAETAREAAGSVGVENFTKIFFDEAGTLKKSAMGWLAFTAGLGTATLIAAFVFLFFDLSAKKEKALLGVDEERVKELSEEELEELKKRLLE